MNDQIRILMAIYSLRENRYAKKTTEALIKLYKEMWPDAPIP